MSLTSIILAVVLLGSTPLALQESLPATTTQTDQDLVFRLGPADTIQVWLWQEPELGVTVMVRPDGKISLPLINEFDVAGKTPEEVRDELAVRYETYLGDPVVSVIVVQIASRYFNVLGQVQSVGQYPLLQRVTILDAIALAGGFAAYSEGKEVLVLRNGPAGLERITVDIRRLIKEGQESPLLLRPFDTVYVK